MWRTRSLDRLYTGADIDENDENWCDIHPTSNAAGANMHKSAAILAGAHCVSDIFASAAMSHPREKSKKSVTVFRGRTRCMQDSMIRATLLAAALTSVCSLSEHETYHRGSGNDYRSRRGRSDSGRPVQAMWACA